ncbi:DUF1127 domain-containing protein [Yoonia sp.]|uniref:DUF1127 domain-containing protein n=1 Tax=Yoonia sp. TaxID=2212373 RepID=UPI00391BC5BB
MSYALRPAQIAILNNRSQLPVVAGLAVRFAVIVTTWDLRRRTRRHLHDLPPHLFNDIGLDCHTAIAEASKPFWRA